MPSPLPRDDPRLPTTAAARIAEPELAPDEILLGTTEHGRKFALDLGQLMNGRLLIQGNSGAGKSWLLRRLIEQAAGRVQLLVVDPEGEFKSLAEHLDWPLIAADRLDLSGIMQLAERARAARLSLVLDLSQQERDEQMRSCAWFLRALVAAPREVWHPAVVAIDEAHLFAPYGGAEPSALRKEAIAALVDLMSRGRKRGLAGALATQRLARLAKSVAAEVSNFLIGVNTLDLDIRRAAETIGWDARRAFDRLPTLTPGNFAAVGRAFAHAPVVAAIGPVASRHLGAAPAMAPPPASGAAAAAAALGLAELAEAAEIGGAEPQGLPGGYRAVRQLLRDPALFVAAQLLAELRPLWPDGATHGSLCARLGCGADELHAAVALLLQWGAVEAAPGPNPAVRLAKGMA
jgi:DNA helicase HerA-like ATPase